MRRTVSLLAITLICGIAVSHAHGTARQPEDQLIGNWTGTWDGDSSGNYTMSLARDEANKLGGTLEVLGDGGYQASFKSIVVDGAKVTMAYDTPDGATEVHMEAALEGISLKGTWRALDASSKGVAQSGTFIGTKS